MALRCFVWVFSQYLGLIKARRKSNRRRGDAEVRGGKGSFSLAGILPSSDLRVSAPPVRCFFFGCPMRFEPTRNAAEPIFYWSFKKFFSVEASQSISLRPCYPSSFRCGRFQIEMKPWQVRIFRPVKPLGWVSPISDQLKTCVSNLIELPTL